MGKKTLYVTIDEMRRIHRKLDWIEQCGDDTPTPVATHLALEQVLGEPIAERCLNNRVRIEVVVSPPAERLETDLLGER